MGKKNTSMRVDWPSLGRETFERFVEALLHRKHNCHKTTWSPDDTGGDGGRDVIVEEGGKKLIYQIKYFTDGLTSKPASRKQQIKRSFASALKHAPDQWILVFPSKINDAMKDYIESLPNRDEFRDTNAPDVSISFLDRPRLDSLIAANPDLINRLEREDPYLLRQAEVYNQERAVLLNGQPDLIERIGSLARLADDLNEDWGVSIAAENGHIALSPYPKHAQASASSPIAQEVTLDIPRDNPLFKKVKEHFKFGARGDYSIPGEYVKFGKYTGPSLFSPPEAVSSLHISACQGITALNGKPFKIIARNEDGSALAGYEGLVNYGAMGTSGSTFEITLPGKVNVYLTIPYDKGQSGNLKMNRDSIYLSPAEVQDGAEIMISLSRAPLIETYIEDEYFGKLKREEPINTAFIDELEALASVADDLDIIQQCLRFRFPMPVEISPIERIWIRALRLVLEGYVAPVPMLSNTFTLLPSVDADSIKPSQEQVILWNAAHNGTLRLAGKDLPVPVLYITHPRSLLKVSDTDGRVVATPADGEVFVMYAPDHLKDASGKVSPWTIPKVSEPKVPVLSFSTPNSDSTVSDKPGD